MRHLILVSMISVGLLSGCCASKMGGAGAGAGEGNIPVASDGGPLTDVHYAFDSSALDATAKDILAQNAAWLKDNAAKTVTVEGHCDERGTREYNMALGERRARSSYDYLRGLGVAAERLSTISYGEEVPLDAGHDETAWARNRRAHFAVK